MRIMLACNAGMSTSLVVAKMQDAAKAQGKDYKIWAVEQGEIQNELGNFDVLLLGPQVAPHSAAGDQAGGRPGCGGCDRWPFLWPLRWCSCAEAGRRSVCRKVRKSWQRQASLKTR